MQAVHHRQRRLGKPDEFPIVCTTYRLTEHFHYWTKNNPYNVQLQPEFFVEIPEELAREKGIANGDRGARHLGARLDRRARRWSRAASSRCRSTARRCIRSDSRSTGASAARGEQRGLARQPRDADGRRPELLAPEYKGFLVKLEKV